ncbi:MAG: hypothetical protein R3C41_04800 [Calditrichia bacterium]|nr:hypothetical protein [Calditrichota bacterium]MCB0285250.1 hypothetical protein [Calditrichota bacterium]MCB9069743.1 hypothetical protein [Calditrichia bacterium]
MATEQIIHIVDQFYFLILLFLLALTWPGLKMPGFFKLLTYFLIVVICAFFFVRPIDPSSYQMYGFFAGGSFEEGISYLWYTGGTWFEGFFDGVIFCFVLVIFFHFLNMLYKHFKK